MNITVFEASGGIGGPADLRQYRHILTLAEDPDPGPLPAPVITTGPGRKSGTAGAD